MLEPAVASSLNDLIEVARAAERNGELEQSLRAYEAAFSRVVTEGDSSRAAELMRWIGRLHWRRRDGELAEEAYEASFAIAVAADHRANIASALNCLGVLSQSRGRMDEAESYYERARELAVFSGDERLAAMVDQNIGTLANTRGDVNVALVSYRSALGRFRKLGDEIACVWALNNLGMAYTDLSDWTTAAGCFDEAFDIADRHRDAHLLGMIELNRAELFLKREELGRARESCDRAFEIFSRLETQDFLGEAYKFYGVLYREMQRPGLAAANFAQAIELAEASEDLLLEAEAQSEWALLELVSGDNPGALQRLNRAHQLFSDLRANTELLDLDSRLDKLEENYMRVMRRWAESIEAKDMYTAGHCERVAEYACMLAEAVGFQGRDLTWFRMGAYLHDVGKTEVPAEVLNKPGKLTDEEWDLMKYHAVAGDLIVAELNFPWDIRPIVRNHHERWDGTGYPDRLAGEAIPLTARILCVADVYDALTTARSYRPALPMDEAMRIMTRDAGKLLDPALFATFRGLLYSEARTAA